MINKSQVKELIELVLEGLGLMSDDAVALLLGTAAQESRMGTYIKQVGGGPALGIFQMEPATEKDIWVNYLAYKSDLAEKVQEVTGVHGPSAHLYCNLSYQIAMARIHYLRVPQVLPNRDDVKGLASYWKNYYNTYLGAGKISEFEENYKEMVL